MPMDLIAMLAVGFAAAGVVVALNHLGGKTAGRQLPKWALPAAVGGAMLGFAIWNEYTWYPRARAQLSGDIVVASAPQERMVYRPWTLLFPLVTRFVAVDRAPAADGASVFATHAYVVNRWGRTQPVPVAFDCARRARADLVEGAELAGDGTLKGTTWLAPEADDPLVRAACLGG